MPRHLDPQLEQRVLDAAQKLWQKGGEKFLSMRVLAREAGTNVPAIYRRFKTREDLLKALMLRTRDGLVGQLQAARSVEEAFENYVGFALEHPREYECYFAQEHEMVRPSETRSAQMGPGFVWMKARLAKRLGGSPEEHTDLVLAIWALAHGTATLLIGKAVPEPLVPAFRAESMRSLRKLLADGEGG